MSLEYTKEKRKKKNFFEFKVLVLRTVQPKWLFPSEIVREAKTIQYVTKRSQKYVKEHFLTLFYSIDYLVTPQIHLSIPALRSEPPV